MKELLWKPSASIENLKKRDRLVRCIRQFFQERGYFEVETPIMAQYGVTDVYLSNIKAIFREKAYWLQTSPEYHMKRLLAAGSGPIFQLSRVFRDDELGRWHNPEFTLLEWYQLDSDHHQLMDEVNDLLQLILSVGPMLRKTYQDCFLEICNVDPFSSSIAELQLILPRYGLENVLPPEEEDKDQYLFLLMSHVIERELSKETVPVAVYHYPPSQAALARIHANVAERFEVYFKGVELANGFHELADAKIQTERFSQDIKQREFRGLSYQEPDKYLLQALAYGLPPCSGIALGIDRVIALALNQSSLEGSLAFDFSRA